MVWLSNIFSNLFYYTSGSLELKPFYNSAAQNLTALIKDQGLTRSWCPDGDIAVNKGLCPGKSFDAALVMHHHFDLDRQALSGLAETDIGFIGLLGPRRRRDDLFKLLTAPMRDALQPRLHAPVGLDLGGFGVEAIALSIAAQLHSVLHGRR